MRVIAFHGVLFDLDGTLLDSAPDLTAALNAVRHALGLPAVGVDAVRQAVSRGAAGMLARGLPELDERRMAWARDRFLQHYAALGTTHSEAFAGIPELLDALDRQGTRWGIVTNKSTALTWPIVDYLGWSARAACIVCGDTASAAKPSPVPVLLAAGRMRLRPAQLVVVGDDVRDIEAGNAAGCHTIAAGWGYGRADRLAADSADETCPDIPALTRRLVREPVTGC